MLEPQSEESMIERVAKALEAAHIKQARKKLEEKSLALEKIENSFGVASSEADRSSAILLFALAEDLMSEGLKANMNPKAHGGWSAATAANGVLATASDRLSLLELLYWIRPRTGADLRLMKSIRNRFAHHADVNSFEDEKITGWISSMTRFEGAVSRVDHSKREPLTVRELYLIRSSGALVNLVTDMAVGPIAYRERIDPSSLQSGNFEDQPENMKSAVLLQARLMLSIYNPAALTA